MKKNHKPTGVLIFEPELKEAIGRLRDAAPDLKAVIERTNADVKAKACDRRGDAGNSDPTT